MLLLFCSGQMRMERIMNHEQKDDLIDLGAVTEETKGPGLVDNDNIGGKLPFAGLSDD